MMWRDAPRFVCYTRTREAEWEQSDRAQKLRELKNWLVRLEREQAWRGERQRDEKGNSPDRSEGVRAFGGRPGKPLGLCDVLNVPSRHVDGKG